VRLWQRQKGEAVLRDVSGGGVILMTEFTPLSIHEQGDLFRQMSGWLKSHGGEVASKALTPDETENIFRMRATVIQYRQLIEDLRDGELCRYDHNDFCQEHYCSRPCKHEVAAAAMDGGKP
jgi:hypothetical protein